MFWGIFLSLCNKNGKSANTIAKEIGISSGSITEWKNGRIPRATTLNKLANYFGVTVEYLKGEEGTQIFQPKGIKIPVLGTVAAGIPIEAIQDIIDYEEIPQEMANSGNHYGLMIKGSSMEPKILAGDVIILRQQSDFVNGDIVVVSIGEDEATCKKIKKTSEGVLLISLNPEYEPMFYSNKQIEQLPIKVIGKVIELRRKF